MEAQTTYAGINQLLSKAMPNT